MMVHSGVKDLCNRRRILVAAPLRSRKNSDGRMIRSISAIDCGRSFQMWEISGRSVCGPVRDHNEDTIDFDEQLGMLVLADGLGGHNAGEVASAIAVTQVMQHLREHPGHGTRREHSLLCRLLEQAVSRANAEVYAAGQEDEACAGMGSTVVAAVLTAHGGCVAHVGDSRCYLVRDGHLCLLTRDHTLLQQWIDLDLLNEAYPGASKRRSALTRAVGTTNQVQVDTTCFDSRAGDILMVASDGLFEPVPDQDLLAVLCQPGPLAAIASELVQLALQLGSDDNVSVILARERD
jgi:protein phosphatase